MDTDNELHPLVILAYGWRAKATAGGCPHSKQPTRRPDSPVSRALPANLCPPSRLMLVGFRRIAADYFSHHARRKSRPRRSATGIVVTERTTTEARQFRTKRERMRYIR